MRSKILSLIPVLIVTTLVSWVSAQSDTKPDPGQLVEQGRKLNDQGRQDEAIALYQQALAASPDLYEAHLAFGSALDLKGDFTQAREHLEHALRSAPEKSKPQALRALAMSYAFSGDAAAAAKYEQQVFDKRLSDKDFVGAAEIANELARIYLESGDIDHAARWYETGHTTALKANLKPAERDLWDFRWQHAQARIAARRNQSKEAQKHVSAAKAILDKGTNPEQAPFFPYLSGYVAFYGGDFPTAVSELGKANQKDPFILSLLAQAHERLGDAARANELYTTILTFNSHNPNNAFARPLAKRKLARAKE